MSTSFTRGDTVPFVLTVTRKNAETGVTTVVDLTGAKIWLTAKRNLGDADHDATFQKGTPNTGLDGISYLDVQNGLASIVISPTDTSGLPGKLVYLYYDVQLEESDGTTTTVDSGQFVVSPDATRAT